MIQRVSILGLLLAIPLLTGCQDTAPAPAQTGEKVLRDPMNYRLSDEDFPSVSGGGIGDFDKKGFDRDWKNFIDPNP